MSTHCRTRPYARLLQSEPGHAAAEPLEHQQNLDPCVCSFFFQIVAHKENSLEARLHGGGGEPDCRDGAIEHDGGNR
jgi:hypothetical protein